MKRYISSAVSIENLRTQFAPDMDDAKFKDLIDLDPSADYEKNKGGKYCPWIFRQDKKGNIPESEYTNLKDALGFFLNNYKKYPKSDIGQYKTVEEFLQDTEAVGNRELTDKEKAKLAKKQAHHASDADKKFLVEDGDWEVWQPLTKAGSVSLSRQGGTKARWCTAYEGDDYYWNRYTKKGPLYIFINTKDPGQKYQLHFESDSWYDIEDRSKGMEAFYQFCSEHPPFRDFFDIKSENGVLTRATSIVGFDETAEEVIIPEGITGIPDMRFPSNVKKIVVPDSVTALRVQGFADLSALEEIRLPEGIKSLPENVFAHCTSLTHIEIPDSVKLYDMRAFQGCTSLKTIKHSANLLVVRTACFMNCTSLETQLPDTVKDIGNNIFKNDDQFETIKIPSLITEIDPGCFLNADYLNNVDLNNVVKVGSKAFMQSSVKGVDLSKLEYIGSSSFRGCADLTSIEFNPNGVVVGPHAFAGCGINGTVKVLPNTQLSISVFDDCPNLTVEWDHEDEPYEFDNIALLKCSQGKCPNLIKANQGYIKIETTEGKVYEVQ